ncbi:hypothetical protein M405DRAFT_870426 [Rhizopogon salebrosus TDB-379]|nr:hypothetical protein M405DRAFT_870544 [Rhizopogon salebrosus TDB-379]KAJ8579314.1 hypothetical protein M405DRAFT_870426 [Rhizopogon salebrosus TDB-379]
MGRVDNYGAEAIGNKRHSIPELLHVNVPSLNHITAHTPGYPTGSISAPSHRQSELQTTAIGTQARGPWFWQEGGW